MIKWLKESSCCLEESYMKENRERCHCFIESIFQYGKLGMNLQQSV